MGIDLTLVEARGIVLSEETVAQLATRFGIGYDAQYTWEADEGINDQLSGGISFNRAANSMSGEVNIPYLAVDRLTEHRYPREMEAGIYARSAEPFRLEPEEAETIQQLLAGTDDEGAEVETFVAFSIT